jgi:hypothetical protein
MRGKWDLLWPLEISSGSDRSEQKVNIAYLQLGVPTYRTSQMVNYGGSVLDAYGWVNVICPAGLPPRAVVGVRSVSP